MKNIAKLCAFQFFCVFTFSLVYYFWLKTHLKLNHQKYKTPTYIDCLMYSMSITSGTGVSGITTTTPESSIVSIIQQGTLISANVFIIYHLYSAL